MPWTMVVSGCHLVLIWVETGLRIQLLELLPWEEWEVDHLLEEAVVLLLPVVLILFLQWAVVLLPEVLLPEVPILFLPWEEWHLKLLLLLLILHLPHNSNLLQLRHLEHHLPV